MVRLQIPFSMGILVTMGPGAFENQIKHEHPILRIEGDWSYVKQPILEWLDDKYGSNYQTGFDGGEYYIDLPSEQDISLFLLRWA